MLVGERMTRNPVTITEETSIDDALHVMRERKIRRLPVLDSSGKMVGIVSDRDLLHAAPSPATSLSVYELHYLLSKLTIKRVMSSPVITVSPSTPVEEAAHIMADNKIGGLPVLENGKLVGIITETDIFKILLEMLGARVPGLRLTLGAHEGKGVLAKIATVVADQGGNIVSVATFDGKSEGERFITLKVVGADPGKLLPALQGTGVTIADSRAG